MNKRVLGSRYEKAAGYYLEQQGYEILQYNYRCRFGEIDLIAKDGEYLVFCEVKYRRSDQSGSALEAVDARKQKRLSLCARQYLTSHGMEEQPARFDVIGIQGNEIIHIEDAFWGS